MSRLQLLGAAAGNPAAGGGGDPEPPVTSVRAVAVITNVGSMKQVATLAATSTWRTRHTAQRDCTDLVLGYGNQYLSAAGENNYTLEVALETSGGALYPATWGGGSLSVTITPSSHAFTDPIPVTFTEGTTFWIRCKITVPSTSSMRPHSAYKTSTARGEGTNYYAGGGDKLTGSWTDLTNDVDPLLPHVILGTSPVSEGRVLALIGDSIMEPVDAWAVQHAEANGVDRLQLGVGAQAMSHLADPAVRARWWGDGILGGADDALLGMGRNDLTGAATIATLQANAITVWNALIADGIENLWQTTCTPLTTSSDGWATVGNQTAGDSGEPRRVAWNAWLRDGAPISGGVAVATGGSGVRAGETGHPLAGVVDTSLAAEAASDASKWKAGWTSDGLHPNTTGKAGIAAAVPAFM